MLLRICLILTALVVVALAASGYLLHDYLKSPAFGQLLLTRVSERAGSEVSSEAMEISIFRGITLQGVRVANPGGLPGDILEARELVLEYRLAPLLSRRVEIDRLTLEEPVLDLFQTQQGDWNFQRFRPTQPAPGEVTASPGHGRGFDLLLSLVRVRGARAELKDREGRILARLQGLDLTASGDLQRKGGVHAEGELKVRSVRLGDGPEATAVSALLALRSDHASLTDLRGQLAEGRLSGEVRLQLRPAFQYRLQVGLEGAAVENLSRAARKDAPMTGTLFVDADLQGTAGRESWSGSGTLRITDGKLARSASQDAVTAFLAIEELREIQFSSCSTDFTLEQNVLITPNLELISPFVKITGQGTLSMEDGNLDHQLVLLLLDEIVDRFPSPVARAFSPPDADRFQAIPFRVWGPYQQPSTDLRERVTRSALDSLMDDGMEGLRRLFR